MPKKKRNTTLIRIPRDLDKEILSIKNHPRETRGDVVERLIRMAKKTKEKRF